MASISENNKSCGSAVNVTAYVGASLTSVARASAASTTVNIKLKVYVYTSSSGSWTYNSLCVWVNGGSKRTVFNSNSGANHTVKGKKYYTSEISFTKTVGLGSTTTTFTVGVNGNAWNPSSASKTFTFTITGIPKGKYTVSFKPNGGTGGPTSQTKTHGTALTLTTSKPTRDGYNFSHWDTKSDGSGTNYSSGGSYTANASVTLYAIWTKKEYTVTYYGNAPSGATVSGVPSSQTKVYGTDLTLRTGEPTCSGWTFVGWNNGSASTSSVEYNPGSTYTNNSDGKMYAIWKKTVTLTYNANGGSGAPAAVSKTIYGYSPSVAITISSTEPTRADHDFLGWGSSSSATSVSWTGGKSLTISANKTIYAVWEETNSITVKYNMNGGNGSLANQLKELSESITLRSDRPTRLYYTFSHWNTKADGSGTSYNPGATYSGGRITLYAQWNFLTTTIKYNANGGSGSVPGDRVFTSPGYSNAGWSVANEDYIQPTPPPGQIFKGWCTSADGFGQFYEQSARVYNLLKGGTITLYAIYTKADFEMLKGGVLKAPQIYEQSNSNIIFHKDYILYGSSFEEQNELNATWLYLQSKKIKTDILTEF